MSNHINTKTVYNTTSSAALDVCEGHPQAPDEEQSTNHHPHTLMIPSSFGNIDYCGNCIPLVVPCGLVEKVRSMFRQQKTQMRVLVFIDFLIYRSVMNHRYHKAETSIHSKKLKKLFGGSAYISYIDRLVQNQIILRGNGYLVDKESKSYSLVYQNSEKGMQCIMLQTNDNNIRTFLKRYQRQDDAYTIEILKHCDIDLSLGQKILGKHFNDDTILLTNSKIDLNASVPQGRDSRPIKVWLYNESTGQFKKYDKALGYFKQNFMQSGWCFVSNKGTLYHCPQDKYIKLHQLLVFIHSHKSLLNFSIGNFFSVIDRTVGRLHSNFTSFPNSFMPCITYNGERFREVDFRCFQYLLLSKSILGQLDNNISIFFQGMKIQPDTKKFHELAARGILYDYLATCMEWNRDQVKFELMHCAFDSRISQDDDDNFKAILRKEFPQVVNCIEEYKASFENDRALEEQNRSWYGELARELQRIEAKFVIKDLRKKLLDIPHFTKHDSIHFPASCFEEALRIIKKFSDEKLGKYSLRVK